MPKHPPKTPKKTLQYSHELPSTPSPQKDKRLDESPLTPCNKTPQKDDSQQLKNQFRPGDKVYGFQKVRKPFTEQIKKEKSAKYITIDEINKLLFDSQSGELKQNELPTEVIEYKNALLEDNKYSPDREDLGHHISKYDANIARSCKFALFYPAFKKIHVCIDDQIRNEELNEARLITGCQ